MTSDTIILVHHIPRTDDYLQVTNEIKKSLKGEWDNGKAFVYFIPTDGEMRVECINPKLVDEKDYTKAKEALDKYEEIANKLAEKGKSLL